MSAPEITKAQAEEAIEDMAQRLHRRRIVLIANEDWEEDAIAAVRIIGAEHVVTLARAGAAVMFPSEEDVERVAEAMELCDTFSSEAFARAAIAAMKP